MTTTTLTTREIQVGLEAEGLPYVATLASQVVGALASIGGRQMAVVATHADSGRVYIGYYDDPAEATKIGVKIARSRKYGKLYVNLFTEQNGFVK